MIHNRSGYQNPRQQNTYIPNMNPLQVNFKILKGVFATIIMGLIGLIIMSIVVMILNHTQSQIIIMGSIIIIISLIAIFCYLFLVGQIIKTQETIEDLRNDEFLLNQQTCQSTSSFFVSYTGQSKFFPIRYLFIYSGVSLILLVSKLLPTSQRYCKDSEQGNYYEAPNQNDENYHYDCYTAHYDPQYKGPILTDYGLFVGIVAILILLFETVRILRYFYKCWKIKYRLYSYVQSVQNTDPQQVTNHAKYFLLLSFCYSLAKLISLVIIAILNENKSALILIGSNIYFHVIMIIANMRIATIIIKSSLFPLINAYKNYMTLLEQFTFRNDCVTNVLFALALASLPFCIAGMIQFSEMYDSQEIINFDKYVMYDCGFVHIFALVLISIHYFSFSCNKTQPTFINNQQIQQEAIVNQQQPFFSPPQQQQYQQYQQQQYQQYQQQQQPFNQNQYQVAQQRENTQPNTQQNQRLVTLPPIQQSAPYINDIKLLNQADCTICLQVMIPNSSEKIIQLKCHKTHIFHQKCINEWLLNHKKCPICNTQF